MKKVISYLITIMMVFTMMPYVAFADNVSDQSNAENENIALYVEQSNELYTENDAEPEVEVIDVVPFSDTDEGIAPNGSGETQYAETVEEAAAGLRSAMVERQTNVVVNIKVDELTEEALTTKCSEIFTEAIKHTGNPKEGDSLKWVWENWNCSISGTSDGSNCYATITYDITYYTTAEQEAALTSAIESLKAELNLDGKTDYEIIKAIYDYMVANISYDYTNLNDNSHKLKYTAYAALVNKTSVCQGYATLFYRLALEYGIDARVIVGESLNNKGESENHAWNIVNLNGKYYNLDATWDSTWDINKKQHTFFLKGSEGFENHTCEAYYTTQEFEALYPIDNNDYETKYSIIEQGDFEYEISGADATLVKYNGIEESVTIPDKINGITVTYIGEQAFTNNEIIKEVILPASVREIKDGYLEPNTYPYVSTAAFSGCINLENVEIPANSELKRIGEWTFHEDKKLSSITLPVSIRTLALSCFEGCEGLVNLELPEGLSSVEQNALSRTSLKELHLPKTCTNYHIYNEISTLERFTVENGNSMYRAHDGVLYDNWNGKWRLAGYPISKTDKAYRVAEFADYILDEAFFKVKYLESLYISDCRGMNHSALPEMSRIRCTITVAESNSYYKSVDGMLLSKDGKILEQVPSRLTGIIVVPDGVEKIANFAAEEGNCSEVELPESIKEIGDSAFLNNSKLEKVTIPDGIARIHEGAFQNCSSLREIIIPEGIEELYTNTFAFCDNLETVTLPKSLRLVKWQAFANCTLLKKVNYAGTESEWNEIDIESSNDYLLAAQKIYSYKVCKVHNWSSNYIVDKEPTCTEEGYEAIHCLNCDIRKDVVVIEKLNHNYDAVVTAPTCTEKGYTTYTCKNDPEHTYVDDYVDAAGHKMTFHAVVSATCLDEGNIAYYTCDVCEGYFLDEDGKEATSAEKIVTEATGHNYEAVVTAPTCEEYGYITYTCSACNDSYVEDGDDPLGHDYEAVVTAPTCTEAGEKVFTCQNDKTHTYKEVIPAKGHTKEVIPEVAATCASAGLSAGEKCSVCGTITVSQETIPALGHDYKAVVTITPTCTEEGVKTFICGKCGSGYTEKIDATGHVWDDEYTIDKDSTCTEKGFKSIHCSKCDETKDAISIDMLDHDWSEDYTIDKEPTCLEQGSKSIHCSQCDAVKGGSEETIDALGHTYTWKEVEPTCTTDGESKVYCPVCGFIMTDVIKAPGHTEVVDAKVQAQVGKEGKTEGKHCSVCREVLVAQKTIPAATTPSVVSKTYTGKYMTPKVYIKDTAGKTIKTVTMSKGKNVGTYSKSVKLTGNYTGTVKVSYKINPKGTSISSLTKVKKGFTVKWKKQTGKMATSRITGYQYRYSTSSKMTNAVTKTIKGYSKTSAKKTGLKAKKKYYIQVRTYKTVNGVKYYSPWSIAKAVKTK